MTTKKDLTAWVEQAIRARGGSATIVEVAEHIWINHESELRGAGPLFFTWQYDMRWAAQRLRDAGILVASKSAPTGVWKLAAD